MANNHSCQTQPTWWLCKVLSLKLYRRSCQGLLFFTLHLMVFRMTWIHSKVDSSWLIRN